MANTPPNAAPAKLCKEIGHLLEMHSFDNPNDLVAHVTFTVNNRNEIIVLEVDTDNSAVDRFIKSRLNYRKLNADAKNGKVYYIPIRIAKV